MTEVGAGHILIRGARQLLTLRGSKVPRRGAELKELGIVSDGAVLIRDGAIVEVGPARRIENLAAARGAIEISAVGRVVMPGFVDSHTHLVFPPPGGPEDEMQDAARAVRSGTGQRLQFRAQGHLEAMARHGTTTVEVKTGCGPDETAEIKLLRVLEGLKHNPLYVSPTFLFRLPVAAYGGETGGVAAAAVRMLEEFLPKIHRRRFARCADLAWDDDAAHQGLFVRYLEAVRKLSLPCKIHAGHRCPAGAIAMAIRHFAVAVDHLEHASTADAAMLAGTGTLATLLPGTGFCNGGRLAPARALIDAGVGVALATDFNPQHTPSLSMQTVVSLACLRLGMTTEEAISAATINGAYVLGRAEKVGSLEVGKAADLVILNCSDYRDLTAHFGVNLVHMTMKRGQCIYQEGKVAPRTVRDLTPSMTW